MKGVLERFEGDKAVILLEEQKEELIVEKDTLPENSDINTWFNIKKDNNAYHLSIDANKTTQEAKHSADLMAKLRAKSRGSKFKKK